MDALRAGAGLPRRRRTIAAVWHVPPDTDDATVDRCLIEVVERHWSLRTRIQANGQGWEQRLAPVPERPLLRSLASTLDREMSDEALADDGGCLIRAYRGTEAAASAVRLVIDHLAADEHAVQLVLRDLDRVRAMATGGPPLPPPGCPYAVASEEQRRLLNGEIDREVDAVRTYLGTTSPFGFFDVPLAEPFGRDTGGLAMVEWRLSAADRRALHAAADAPMSDLMLAAAVVSRAFADALAAPVVPVIAFHVNRPTRELREVVGWLSNVVVVPIAAAVDLREHLRAARATWLQGMRYAGTPHVVVKRRLAPEDFEPARVRSSLSVSHLRAASWGGMRTSGTTMSSSPPRSVQGGPGGRGRIHLAVTSYLEGMSMRLMYESGRYESRVIEAISAGVSRALVETQ